MDRRRVYTYPEPDNISGDYDNSQDGGYADDAAYDSQYVGGHTRQDSDPPADYELGNSPHVRSNNINNNNNNNFGSVVRDDDRYQHAEPRYNSRESDRHVHDMEEGGVGVGGGGRATGHHYERHGDRRESAAHEWLRHRRTKSQHLNGYDFYRHQIQYHVNRGFQHDDDDNKDGVDNHYNSRVDNDDDADRRSVQSLNFEDLKRARQILATVRVRRKSRKHSSRKRRSGGASSDDEDFVDDVPADYDDDDEEEVGLPSAREKMKSLAERLVLAKQLQSAKEVARQYRDSLWALDHEGVTFSSGRVPKKLQRVGGTFSDALRVLNFWSHQFKEIEGHFGIATATYFRFTRWLVKINFLVLLLFLGFIYIPQLTYSTIFSDQQPDQVNITDSSRFYEETFKCSNAYSDHLDNITRKESDIDKFLNIALGTGFIENTMLFYGYYSNLSFWRGQDPGEEVFGSHYNMGLAYLLTVGASFIVLFLLIVKNSSNTIKETVMDFDQQAFPKYANAVFGGWDYCINSENMAAFKQNIIYKEFMADLEEIKLKRKKQNRTTGERSKLYLKRFGINLFVIALLGASFYAIFAATDFLLEKQTEQLSFIVALLIQYLPSIIISVLNFFIPEIFLKLAEVEEYSNNFTTRITIVRAVFLRLSMVGVLIVSLYYQLQYERERTSYTCPEEENFFPNVTRCCGNPMWKIPDSPTEDEKGTVKCWESYVGQQFYKLAVADFAAVTLATLLLKLPRRLVHSKLKQRVRLVSTLGLAKFDLPLEVLDIVYSQTLCWVGMFFTPLLPAITFVKVFFFFFLKKFELLFVCETPKNAYRASRSYSFFQTILLVSFIMIAGLLGYMIGNIQPSKSCGPFRLYSSDQYVMFDTVSNQVNSWPSTPRNIVKYFGTVAFFLPAFLVLLLSIYYYWATSQGYKKMEKLLKLQLKSEAYDKQYLLARVDEVIKKGQLVTHDNEPI
ncbi:transmembrane channel-like protein 7 [Aplysia californica]|uniref:Transmembrane channel-like protein 7 n=1 Tax=Aplysia californica TaxID=6500 RepID=A0ABM0K9P6_APLCA|nr:transmembrane channel-like protein 7 [Aplysia californica]